MGDENKWANHARLIALSKQGKSEEEIHEDYTEAAQQRRRDRANKPYIPRSIFHNRQATKDGIRHFAEGIGDSNPLFNDEEYAKKTKHGTVIAPGAYLYTINWINMGYGGPGVHGFYSGGNWEWYKPIKAGDEYRVVGVFRDLVPKEGKMGAGRTWIDYGDVMYVNQNGEIVGKEEQHIVLVERGRAGSAKKFRNIPKPIYTKEQWVEILDLYENEEVRGAEPRYWEDVQVGDQVGPMIKGPLSVRDIIGWLMGGGSPYIRCHKIEYEYEKRHPHTLEYVDTGEADNPGDVPELVHILDPFAQTIGIDRIYDYGNQRMSWLCNLFTNWMGDDGFLWKMSGDLRTFNLAGDITRFEGKVVKKYKVGDHCCVDIEAWAKNQRDQWSVTPHMSTVILPSKEFGPVVYPEPAESLKKEILVAKPLDQMIKEGTI
ncbi:MAG: MaoC family dehydratase N-terminal domain-containing protein [Desulfobacterales bacterium]|jgi:acyl dehydratase|nr:MaoC family dehydratase N-terminal domain-containing protein [Desulfobacterales bacterium]